MATGTNYNKKADLLNAIQALVYTNDNNETASDNIQKAIKNVVESLMEQTIVDNSNYTLYRKLVDNDFIIRLVFKNLFTFTNLELLPSNLANLATFDDIRYLCYNPTSDGLAKKYTFNLTFNKLVSNSPFVLAGEAYFNQLHLFDNVGDTSSTFNYSTAGGTGNYDSAIIKTTGFNISGTVTPDAAFTNGGLLEFTFKGSLIGKL